MPAAQQDMFSLALLFSPLVLFWLHFRFIGETRFKVALIAAATLGIGSFLFHATLLYHMQCWDEVPMLWTAVACAYMILEAEKRETADD